MKWPAIVGLVVLGTGCRGPGGDPNGGLGVGSETPSVPPSFSAEAPVTVRPERQIVWVSVEDDQRVVAVDLRRRRVIRRFQVSGVPHNLTVAQDGSVVVALQGSGRVAIIRGRRSREVRLGGSPHDVKLFGRTAVVANEGAARLDLVSIDGDRTRSVALKANPHDLAIAPDSDRAWVTLDGSDEMAVVDLGRRRVLRYVPTAERPHDLIFTPDGRLWVTDWDGGLHVFSRRGRLVRTIPVGVEAHHLAFTPSSWRRKVWVTDHEARRIFVIDARALHVVDVIRTRGAPHHVAITPHGRLAAVADHDGGVLLVYRTRTRRLVARIPVGDGPHGVWAEPAR